MSDCGPAPSKKAEEKKAEKVIQKAKQTKSLIDFEKAKKAWIRADEATKAYEMWMNKNCRAHEKKKPIKQGLTNANQIKSKVNARKYRKHADIIR